MKEVRMGAQVFFQFQLNANDEFYPSRFGFSGGNCFHMLLNSAIASCPLVI
jgi:hypothetical protein